MPKIIHLLLFISFIYNLNGQAFEGYIMYEYQYIDSLGEDVTAQLSPSMGSEQHYFIDSSNYVALNENEELIQLYNSATNTYYFVIEGQIKSLSASFQYPKNTVIEKSEVSDTIIDFDCNAVVFTSEMSETTYFTNDSIFVEPLAFTEHIFGNWALFLKETEGALPLKFITKSNGIIQIATAQIVKRMEIEDRYFDINTFVQKE